MTRPDTLQMLISDQYDSAEYFCTRVNHFFNSVAIDIPELRELPPVVSVPDIYIPSVGDVEEDKSPQSYWTR